MLIDQFLPEHEIVSRYSIDIHASAGQVYAAIRATDLGESAVIRWLFRIRGLRHSGLTLDGLTRSGFTILAENPPHEFLIGIVGKFWTPFGGRRAITAATFKTFTDPGFAKAVMNFALAERTEGWTKLTVETRVHCTDSMSAFLMRMYWTVVGPFSGWIRKEMLTLIKERVERG